MKMVMIKLLIIFILVAGLFLFDLFFSKRTNKSLFAFLENMLLAYALFQIAFVIFLWFNHINFPLHLDLMEGTVLHHFSRAFQFQAIYPEPSPEFVPLAYNPLYYILSIPFGWLMGVNLFALRFVSILGMLVCGTTVYLFIYKQSRSLWWSIVSAGLFTSAYMVMDGYLDTAHSDSWFLGSALLGTYILHTKDNTFWNITGLILLIASFWFKQHGALFAIGGVLYLTQKNGVKGAWLYWIMALVFGPLLYLAGPWFLGSHFHYFTWTVPRSWSQLNLHTFIRLLKFITEFYLILGMFSVWYLFTCWKNRTFFNNILCIQFGFAILSAIMGSLDWGSSNNVYIPVGTWLVTIGTLGIHHFANSSPQGWYGKITYCAILASFILFFYNPKPYIIPSDADDVYQQFIHTLQSLDGNVYAPWQGYLGNDFPLYPAAHWVGLEDMVRGANVDTSNRPEIRNLLNSCIHPDHNAFIITNKPLKMPLLEFLNQSYDLKKDFSNQFESLRCLPKRWDHGWPRYLYQNSLVEPSISTE